MPNWGGAASGAAGGAAAGTAIAPGLGTAIGAVAGFFSGLFGGKSESEQKKENIERGLHYLKEQKRATIITGMDRLSKLIAKNKMSAQIGAGKRALAMGQEQEAESMSAPAVAQAEAAGGQAVNNFMQDTEERYRQAESNLVVEGSLNMPYEPGVGDYLLPLGQGVLQTKMNMDYANTMSKSGPTANMGVNNGGAITPGTGTGPVAKIEGTRNPVMSGEFAATGDNAPANTLGLGAYTAPKMPRMDRIIPRTFGTGSVYPRY